MGNHFNLSYQTSHSDTIGVLVKQFRYHVVPSGTPMVPTVLPSTVGSVDCSFDVIQSCDIAPRQCQFGGWDCKFPLHHVQ